VRDFFFKHNRPVNAVLCVAGPVAVEEVKALAEKWFGDIPAGEPYERRITEEPQQTAPRVQTVHANVPLDAIWKAWHIPARREPGYYAADIITEVMGNGQASRLYQKLVKEEKLFSTVACYHTGSLDPGLLLVEGKVAEGKSIEEADAAIVREMQKLVKDGITDAELQKAKNKLESAIEFEDISLLSRAANLAFYELLGDAAEINTELEKYAAVTGEEVKAVAQKVLRAENCSTLYYRKRAEESTTPETR
jgi:zinc protease